MHIRDVNETVQLLKSQDIKLRFIKTNKKWLHWSDKENDWLDKHNFDVENIIAECLKDAGRGKLCGAGFGKLMSFVRDELRY